MNDFQQQDLASGSSSDQDSDSDCPDKENEKKNEYEEVLQQPDALYEFMIEYEKKVQRYEDEKRRKLIERGETIIPDVKQKKKAFKFKEPEKDSRNYQGLQNQSSRPQQQ